MKKGKNARWVMLLMYGLMGVGLGLIYAPVSAGARVALGFCEMLVSAFVCIYAQILVHEAGHLVFGLLSGYRFRSFRVGSLMWIRTANGIERRRQSLAGTGGQCLLSPPEGDADGIPCGWYLMGGAAMNLLSALVALALYFALRSHAVLARFLLTWAISGATVALTNGLPIHMGLIDNDGCTARTVCTSQTERRAFLTQMRLNDFLALGGRIRDVSLECLPAENDLSGPMTATLAVFSANRLMDAHRFDEARAEMDRLLAADSAIVGLYMHLLACDRMYLALLDGDLERLNALFTPAQRSFMKQMRTNPSILRTQYAYALLAEKDAARADAYLAQFERAVKHHPYPGEIESERELIALAKEKGAPHNG